MRRAIAVPLVGLACALAGCGQRVNQEKTVEVSPGLNKAPIILEGPKSEQKIKVEFNSADSPLDVYVIVGKDENAILAELDKAEPKAEVKSGIKASAKQSKGATLDATIPAGQDYGVYLVNAAKKTSVKVKVYTP
jgi:hypothetical protein